MLTYAIVLFIGVLIGWGVPQPAWGVAIELWIKALWRRFTTR